ncbi:hypothetical protein TRVL_06500 [Trypanosoma vivax]|nr:hypothetical protein TRVL_06500 [Trypanosoma vivax]
MHASLRSCHGDDCGLLLLRASTATRLGGDLEPQGGTGRQCRVLVCDARAGDKGHWGKGTACGAQEQRRTRSSKWLITSVGCESAPLWHLCRVFARLAQRAAKLSK